MGKVVGEPHPPDSITLGSETGVTVVKVEFLDGSKNPTDKLKVAKWQNAFQGDPPTVIFRNVVWVSIQFAQPDKEEACWILLGSWRPMETKPATIPGTGLSGSRGGIDTRKSFQGSTFLFPRLENV
jgi:hypothetical protein